MHQKLFFLSILSSLIFTIHSSNSQCLDHQKSLLLQLRNELVYDSSLSTKLVKWNQRDDCCKWHGVECDAAGHVISLQLDGESISGEIGDSSSLFKLVHLQKLNLAFNDFNYTHPIPRGIHNLTYLTHLNLSYADFGGQVPAEISSLTRLVSLDVSNYYFSVSLEYPNLEMLVRNLTGLRELYLDGVDIISFDERGKWSHIISSYLPHLTSLSLRYCSLSGPLARSFWQLHSLSILRLDGNNLSTVNLDLFANFPNLTSLSLVDCSLSGPLARSFWQLHSLSILQLDVNDLSTVNLDLFAKFTSLTTLSLVYCSLQGSFPNMIFHIPTLQNLDLSWNRELSGSIPPFTQTGSLKSIRLSRTNFSGLIPTSISNLKNLSYIDLYDCQFTGPIPSSFANLTQLIYADLSNNFFRGSLSSTLFGALSNLVSLNLDSNSFSGNIPHSLFSLPSLQRLWLSENRFTGQVEEFRIFNVSNIVFLDLSGNRLEGPIPDSFFQLQRLETLFLARNLFGGTFQLDKIRSLANLYQLDLSDNNLSVDVGSSDNSSAYGLPQLALEYLYISSCNVSVFPKFIKHCDMIRDLDLSNNRIVGEIPTWIWGTKLERLNLSFNLLTDVPKPYHIPASLYELYLHSNKLSGELHLLIPPTITSDLQYLSLANNNLSGSIPTSLCTATDLSFLDLSVNKLSGKLPSCLLENATNLYEIHLGQNNISGSIPDNFPHDCNLRYFNLNNNNLEGKIPKSLESCNGLEYMNVGNNIINDTFPCMLLSSRLRVLVLHSNRFHGEVKCHNSWPYLQVLDISSNDFNGSLESFNFSSWRAMVTDSDAQLRRHFEIYNDVPAPALRSAPAPASPSAVTITMKGNEMELVEIRSDFSTVDLSCNNFKGEIPNAIGDLSSLLLLNLSHNALNGSIPKSFGKLGELESLDLSQNQLSGHIPMEIAGLTFLSVLNLSYNNLVGEIPNGRQLQTFSADSFKGNPGLCGFNLNISCRGHTDLPPQHENVEEKREIEWEYVCAALGYVVGLGSIVWLLLFCRSFRQKYFGKIEEVVEEIFDARDRRRRRRRASRVARNRVRRQ